MNSRILALSLALLLSGTAVCFPQDPNLGTWKLNEAKSHIPAGTAKVDSATMSAEGGNFKVVQDGTDKDGKPFHSEWTGKFDGKDYPVTGSPTTDTRSYKEDGARKMVAVSKKDGKVVTTAHSVVSDDGKTRTVSVTTDVAGKKVSYMVMTDKQE